MVLEHKSAMAVDGGFPSPPAKRRKLTRGVPESKEAEASFDLPPSPAASDEPSNRIESVKTPLDELRTSSPQLATPPQSIGVASINPLKDRLLPAIKSALASRERKIPSWQNLPPHILDDIFMRLANKIKGSEGLGSRENDYLLRVGLLCRAFFSSISSALYYSPGLSTIEAPHKLMDTLQLDPTQTICNYRNKVRAIEIEVMKVLRYSYGYRGRFDVATLMPLVPRLRSLELTHNIRTRSEDVNSKLSWSMTTWLFEAIDNAGIELKTWSWDKRMRPTPGNDESLQYMVEAHLKPAFHKIDDISFVNYNEKASRGRHIRKDDIPERELAEAIGLLPALTCISFWSSSLVNYRILPLLPNTLKELMLQDCNEVCSEDFVEFLLTHGANMECIELDGCQSLSLSFLTKLRDACPKLQQLHVDMRLRSSVTYDSQAGFKSLLSLEEVPTWPSTLQWIDLQHLRSWDRSVAEICLNSLISAAQDLPSLRCLKIRGQLSLSSYLERARLRTYWVTRMRRVFLRQSPPPDDALESIAVYQELQRVLKETGLEEEMDEDVNGIRHGKLSSTLISHTDQRVDATVPQALMRSIETEKTAYSAGRASPSRPAFRPAPSRIGKVAKSTPSSLPQSNQATGDSLQSGIIKSTEAPLRQSTSTRRSMQERERIEKPARESPPPRRTRSSTTNKSTVNQSASARQTTSYNTRQGGRHKSRVNYAESSSNVSGTEDESESEHSESQHETQIASRNQTSRSKQSSTGQGRTMATRRRAVKEEPVPQVEENDFVQGKCDLVEILLDSGTPAEEQYNEEDFLDSEPSDDADWDEVGPMSEDTPSPSDASVY